MRQHHTNTQRLNQAQLRYQWLKIMAVCTQAMQPDDAGARATGWIDFDSIECWLVLGC